MEINIPVHTFNADPAIDLWWSQCSRRPNQRARKEYTSRPTRQDQEPIDDDNHTLTLDE